jgi:DNA-directed RNA polymerase specialized sigma24 family protein
LKEYSGLSYKEIATLMEIDKELVKSRLYKVRQKLINRISKLVK